MSSKPSFENRYNGFSLREASSRKGSAKAPKVELIPEVNVDEIEPKDFYERFVAERRPCLLKGSLKDAKFGEWTNEYMKQKAGDKKVNIELRANEKESFGRGKAESMTFGDFLQRLEKGDGSVYMTTQDLGTDPEGRPNVMSAPVTQLQDDFPLSACCYLSLCACYAMCGTRVLSSRIVERRPGVMGHLVPVNYNIWMGANKAKSDSGLHHDYHDNLYVLLRGKKIFRLYGPDEAHRMYTRGRIETVHPNGRICYEGLLTEADGSEKGAMRSLEAEEEQQRAEEELELAEEAVEAGEEGAKERLERAEKLLDKALKAVLDAEDGNEEDEDEDEEGGCKLFGPDDGEDEEDEEDDDEEGEDEDEEEDEEEEDGARTKKRKGMDAAAQESMGVKRTTADPLSFSMVDQTLPPSERKKQFPLIADAVSVDCEVNAGHMLYLPAGWFHQVFSMGSADGQGHVAFNYWFHPPDAGKGRFEAPYTTDFWPRDWRARVFPQKE